jgi:hypothetical protein
VGALLATGVLAIGAATDADLHTIMARIQLPWLLASIAIFVIGNLLVGPRFLALLPRGTGRRPGAFACGSLFFAGNVFTLLIPGPVGELAAIAALREHYEVPARAGLATSLHSRFVGLFVNGALAMTALAFLRVDDQVGRIVWVGSAVVASGGVLLGTASARPQLLQALGSFTLAVLERHRSGSLGWMIGRVDGQLSLFARTLQQVWHAPRSAWFAVFCWSLLIQAVQLLSLFCATQALSLSPSLPSLMLAQGVGSLMTVALFMFPGGLGTFELAFVGCFVGAGGLTLLDAGLLVLTIRVVHLSGIACAGIALTWWARILLSADVLDAVESGDLDESEPAA